MKKIKLTQDKYALVDDKDFKLLSKHKWTARKHRHNFYAYRAIWINGKQISIQMHQVIMGEYPEDKPEIDHIDGDGLNNCRNNLKFVTNQENQRKRKLNSNNTSGQKGIYWNKKLKKWQAYGYINYKSIYIGIFKDIKEAIKMRKKFIKNNYK